MVNKRRQPDPTVDEMESIAEDQHREFLLSALRAASLRAKLMDADLTSIGIALKNNLIGSDTALSWARDAGVLWMIGAVPDQVGRIAKSNETQTGEETTDAIPEA